MTPAPPPVDVPYAAPGGQPLLARLYLPAAAAPPPPRGSPRLGTAEVPGGADPGAHPAVVEVHGGAWSGLDRTAGALYCRALAAAGFVVASIDFRQGPAHRHPAASADVAAAVRWLRGGGVGGATSVAVDPDRIALVGSSSGGHLALLAATRPDGAEHRGVPIVVDGSVVDPGEVSAAVACVAALWPPVDPLARYRYARERAAAGEGDDAFRPRLLAAGTEAYFGDEATMAAASVADRIGRGATTHLPPAWVAYPELDRNVPRSLVDDLADAWHIAGGQLDVTTYAGEPHAFGHRPGASTDRFVADLITFLHRHLVVGPTG